MDKKTLRDVDLKGKRVIMRVDFNVPVKDGVIKDDTRIKGALPSIRYVLEQGGSLILMSHLGRPDEKGITPDTSLKLVADYLSKLLGKPVAFAPDCAKADAEVAALKPGDVLMLENTRYHKEEQAKCKQCQRHKWLIKMKRFQEKRTGKYYCHYLCHSSRHTESDKYPTIIGQ